MILKSTTIFCIIILCALQGSFLYPGKITTLQEVLKPSSINAAGDQLFVVSESRVQLYSLKSLK